MRFDVAPMPLTQTARPFDAAAQAALNAALQRRYALDVPPLTPGVLPVRRVALLERQTANGTPLAVLLGTATATSAAITPWSDSPVASDLVMSADQYWDIINLSADAHPIHLHGFDFRVRRGVWPDRDGPGRTGTGRAGPGRARRHAAAGRAATD